MSPRAAKPGMIVWNGRFPGVLWGQIFPDAHRPGMGVMEIAPGRVLPKHHHEPEEIYFVLSGRGSVKVYRTEPRLEPGTCVHIPSNAAHLTRNTGSEPLRILYTFPLIPFAEVEYHLD